MCGKPTCLLVSVLAVSVALSAAAGAAVPDPVGWWQFDDGVGTAAQDASGNGNNGTLHGDPAWIDGRLDGALQLDGSGDYVELPIGSVISALEEGTLALWVNWSGQGGDWQRILDLGSGTTSYIYLCPDNGSTGALRVAITAGNSVWDEVDSDAGALETGWHHIAITVSRLAETMVIYLDGDVVATLNGITNTLDDLGETTQNWIGRSQYDADPYFNGSVDDFRIYNVVLAEAEIETVMRGVIAGYASQPSPENTAFDMPRDVALTWTPGASDQTHDVYFGTSFDDVNDATRADPRDVLVSQGQTAAAYAPDGLLAFGQTYYWRIDEVNAAPDNTIFRSDVWRFTTEPFGYAVENISATTNGVSQAGSSPERTIDGSGLNEDGQHSTSDAAVWAASSAGGEPVYVQYEFDRVYKLYEMHVWNYNVLFELILGFGFKDVTIEYSVDGVEWTVFQDLQFAQATARSDYTAGTIVDFEGIAAKYIRLTANTGYGMTGTYGLSEVRFFYLPVHARYPEPADGAEDVNVTTMLTWRAGREAASHEVYFGADAEALALIDTVTDSRSTPGVLDLGTTYYWQIVEVNDAEAISTWPGDIWSFVTQDSLVIDDFESYTDDEGGRIYETWIDGWANGSGATVGYLDAPFTERTTVHGGKQAMPLFYENTGGIANAEAELVLQPAQDWTQAAATTLTVFFYGDLANDPGQVYVKINGTTVAEGGSTTMALWKQWNIDLAATGVNLQSVTSLVVGIESSGSGVIYVDDLRLYRAAPEIITPADPGAGNLAAHYSFEDNLADVTGSGYDGTAADTSFYEDAAGDLGRALSFDGINDYVELPIGSLISSLTDITVAIWVDFPDTGGSWQRIFDFGTSSSEGYMFLCPRIETSGPMRFVITPASGAGESIVDTAKTLPSGWHHVAVTIDSATMTVSVYLDGAPAAGGATGTLPRDLGATTQNWLGRSQYEADDYFTGLLADFRIYDRALSAGEVRYLAGDR